MLKVEFKPIPNTQYIEVGQINPLRFAMMVEEKGVLKNVTNFMKCRDFFNDIVYKIQTGKGFTIYGLSTETMPLEKKDKHYLLLDQAKPELWKNIKNVLNPWLKKNSWPEIETEEKKNLVGLDALFFKNTHNISLATLLIRCCNYKTLEKFEDIKKCTEEWNPDVTLISKAFDKKVWFGLKTDHIWYHGKTFNTNEIPKECAHQLGTFVHNNGICGWYNSGLV